MTGGRGSWPGGNANKGAHCRRGRDCLYCGGTSFKPESNSNRKTGKAMQNKAVQSYRVGVCVCICYFSYIYIYIYVHILTDIFPCAHFSSFSSQFCIATYI